VALLQDRYGEAEQHYQGALDGSRAVGDRRGEAQALRGLGDVALLQGRYGEAEQHYQGALDGYRTIGLFWSAINNCSLFAGSQALNQASAHRAAGEVELASQAYELARDLYGWGVRLLAETPKSLPVGNLPERLTALSVRITEFGDGHQ
jgi:tetratricopeptide (TPR) repeat protein